MRPAPQSKLNQLFSAVIIFGVAPLGIAWWDEVLRRAFGLNPDPLHVFTRVVVLYALYGAQVLMWEAMIHNWPNWVAIVAGCFWFSAVKVQLIEVYSAVDALGPLGFLVAMSVAIAMPGKVFTKNYAPGVLGVCYTVFATVGWFATDALTVAIVFSGAISLFLTFITVASLEGRVTPIEPKHEVV